MASAVSLKPKLSIVAMASCALEKRKLRARLQRSKAESVPKDTAAQSSMASKLVHQAIISPTRDKVPALDVLLVFSAQMLAILPTWHCVQLCAPQASIALLKALLSQMLLMIAQLATMAVLLVWVLSLTVSSALQASTA